MILDCGDQKIVTDVLVTNAGICPFAEFLTLPYETWERTRQVNMDGAFCVVQGESLGHRLYQYMMTLDSIAVSNQMKRQTPQGGSIIAMSSISALVGGELQWYVPTVLENDRHSHFPAISHYTPTKAAILSLMQSCAVALGKYNIRCNAILPGTIATDINKEDLSDSEKRDYMIKRTALGRIGCKKFTRKDRLSHADSILQVPDDVAGPMVFLASDLAKYVTGAQLLVDGGLFVNLQ